MQKYTSLNAGFEFRIVARVLAARFYPGCVGIGVAILQNSTVGSRYVECSYLYERIEGGNVRQGLENRERRHPNEGVEPPSTFAMPY